MRTGNITTTLTLFVRVIQNATEPLKQSNSLRRLAVSYCESSEFLCLKESTLTDVMYRNEDAVASLARLHSSFYLLSWNILPQRDRLGSLLQTSSTPVLPSAMIYYWLPPFYLPPRPKPKPTPYFGPNLISCWAGAWVCIYKRNLRLEKSKLLRVCIELGWFLIPAAHEFEGFVKA